MFEAGKIRASNRDKSTLGDDTGTWNIEKRLLAQWAYCSWPTEFLLEGKGRTDSEVDAGTGFKVEGIAANSW